MAITTKSKKQQKSHHAIYRKHRNKLQQQQIKTNKINKLIEQILSLLAPDQEEAAFKRVEQAIKKYPKNTELLNGYGTVLGKLKQYETASQQFEKVLQIDPHNSNALFNYALTLLNLGRYEEAVNKYEELSLIQSDNIKSIELFHYYHSYGICLQHLERHEAAIKQFNKALNIKPNDLDVLNQYEESLKKLGRYSELTEKFEQALQFAPNDAEVLHHYGIALIDLDEYDAAVQKLEYGLQLRPNNIEILLSYSAALIYSGNGNYEKAISMLKQAAENYPNEDRILHNYGGVLIKNCQFDLAIQQFEKILHHKPQDIEALINSAFALERLRQYELAIKKFEQTLSVANNSNGTMMFCCLALGCLYYKINAETIGDNYLKLAIEYSDDKDDAKIMAAREMFSDDRHREKGIAILQEITETSPYYKEASKSLVLNLSPKAFFEMFNSRPDEENAIKDTGLLNRALYHKIANEIAILKETVHLLLSDYHINEPKLTDILARIDAILEGVKQRRAQEKSDVEAIPAKDYDAILATISKTAHDISDFVNNKLAAIEERVRLILAQPSENDILLKKLNKMLARIKSSQNALNDLKSVNEGIKLHDSHFKIAELFEQWQQTPNFRHAAISLDIHNGDEIFYGDVEKIKSFLKELIENAVRHNPNKADLQIRITSEDVLNPEVITQSILSGERKFLLITVSDNGQGIPLKNKDWVFVPLKTTSDEGSGLGLFIIRRTLKEMHGQIVETGTNGACFEIYIPYREGDEAWNK